MRWLIYLKERFPLPVYILLSAGFASSGVMLNRTFHWLPLGLGFIGCMLFFAELRLMDELKDFEKDLVAHPDRPLPRGLLTAREVASQIQLGIVVMVLFGCLVGYLTNPFAGQLYLFVVFYLWLMYKEFYFGHQLQQFPLIYAVSHQVILLPLVAFTATVGSPVGTMPSPAIYLGLMILGSFFSYEICRKLDPHAHPLLKTYLHVYGHRKTFFLVVGTSAFAVFGAQQLGVMGWLGPMNLLLLFSLHLLSRQPEKYKVVEIVATLSLALHLWILSLDPLIRSWL